MSSEEDSSLEVEIEALKAIYIHELDVHRTESQGTTVKVSLHPATADNAEEQYVRMDLVFNVPQKYPDIVPEIQIRNPRGLSDEKIEKISEELRNTAEDNVGCPMLYQLIEVAKDHLTQENVPCCQCTICLYGFVEGDVFTKTQCYHYFHSHCLARYVQHSLEEMSKEGQESSDGPPSEGTETKSPVLCPVCRLPASVEDIVDKQYPPPVEMSRQPGFSMTPELHRLQREMAELYLAQQSRGAIINVDAEKNKFLLEISSAPESSGGRGGCTMKNRKHLPRPPGILFAPETVSMERRIPARSDGKRHQQQRQKKDQQHHQYHRRPTRASDTRSSHNEVPNGSLEQPVDDSLGNQTEETPPESRERRRGMQKQFFRGNRQQGRFVGPKNDAENRSRAPERNDRRVRNSISPRHYEEVQSGDSYDVERQQQLLTTRHSGTSHENGGSRSPSRRTAANRPKKQFGRHEQDRRTDFLSTPVDRCFETVQGVVKSAPPECRNGWSDNHTYHRGSWRGGSYTRRRDGVHHRGRMEPDPRSDTESR